MFIQKINKCLGQIDRKKATEMLMGIAGIYFSFLLLGLVYEKITNKPYSNSQNHLNQPFRITSGLILVEKTVNFILGTICMKATVSKEERVAISHKNLAIVGFFLWMSSITQTESMYIVSYPLIMMTKSCSLISVILVGVLCSRVRNKSLKLGPKKIIVAIVVSGGIIMFRVFDPEANLESEKATELTGLGLLLLSLFADGFVPDFQAEIKEKFKPTPIEMLVSVNKWVAIFALIYLVGSWKAVDFINYCIEHTEFVWDMLIVSVLSFLGQLFVYRMIKMFRQHIVPFAIATRKIMTVGVSIVYFKHDWSWEQVVSILVVLGVMMHEFLENVGKEEEQKGGKEKDARTAVELVQELGGPESPKQKTVQDNNKK